jgi:two-component system response regulator
MNSVTTERAAHRCVEILLVEDNLGDVLLTREAFRKSKLANRLSVAEDGEQALAMLRRESAFRDQPRPDLILLDLNLPKLDGGEVLQRIKEDPKLRDIPVVILSGSHAQMEVTRSYALHANAHIVKPVNFERLQEIIATVENFWFMVVALPGRGRWNH